MWLCLQAINHINGSGVAVLVLAALHHFSRCKHIPIHDFAFPLGALLAILMITQRLDSCEMVFYKFHLGTTLCPYQVNAACRRVSLPSTQVRL